VAALAGLPTGGVGALGVEFAAFAGGSALAKNLLVKPFERAIGVDKTLEEAQQEAPEVAQTASILTMLPFAAKSALGYLETASGAVVKEAIAKGASADLTGAALGAVGKRAAGAALGGAAFEPIRYGVEKGLQKVGVGEEPAPVTGQSILESAGQMLVLGGVGHDKIESAGLPETARVADNLKSPDALRNLSKVREEASDPHDEVEEAYRLAEDHIKVGNRTEASGSLTYAKDLEKEFPVDSDTQKNRDARFTHLDGMIERLPINETYTPLPKREGEPLLKEAGKEKSETNIVPVSDYEGNSSKWAVAPSDSPSDPDRPVVFVKIGDTTIPFYRSSKGTSGKKEGGWFPFFGVGSTEGADWIIKGSNKDLETGHGVKEIKQAQDYLNEKYKGTAEQVIDQLQGEHGDRSIMGLRMISKQLFGKAKFEDVSPKASSNHIDSILSKYKKEETSTAPLKEGASAQPPAGKVPPPVSVVGEAPAVEPPVVVGHKVVSRKEGNKTLFDTVQVLRDTEGNETTGDTIVSGVSRTNAMKARRNADRKEGVAADRPPKYDPFGTEEMPVSHYLLNNIGRLESRSTAEARARREGKDLKDTYEPVKRAGRGFLADPTHNKIFGGGVKPDEAVQSLIDGGILPEGSTTDDLWDALANESLTSKKRQEEFTERNRYEMKQQREYDRQQKREARAEIREGKKRLKDLESRTDERSIAMAKTLREEISKAEAELKPSKLTKEKTAEKPSELKGTKLLSAAYRHTDGVIYYGADHISAMRDAGVPEEQIPKDRTSREDDRFGFRTDTHEFVTRDEGEAIARKSGQIKDEAGFDATRAENENHKFHSTDTELENHQDYENPLVSEGKLAPGASNIKELKIAEDKKAFVRAANLHQERPELSNSYSKWWSEYKRRLTPAQKREANKFSQEKKQALFEQGRTLLEYSNQFGMGIGKAVENSKQWWGKTAKQIKNAEAKREINPIRLDNEQMNTTLRKWGYDELPETERKSQEQSYQEAVARMTNPEDPYYTENLIDSLNSNARPIDDVETFVLRIKITELENAVNEARNTANSYKDPMRKASFNHLANNTELEAVKLMELDKRVASLNARAQAARQAHIAEDMSFVSMKNAITAILGKDIPDQLREKLERIAKNWTDFNERLKKANKAAKENRTKESARQIFEDATQEERQRKGKPARTPDEQIRDFTARIKGAKEDPAELGQAIRNLFKAIHKREGTTDIEKLTEATHQIAKKQLGKDWTIDDTQKAIQASGQYYQMTMKAAIDRVRDLPKTITSVIKQVEATSKIKDETARRKRVAEILKKNKIEVRNAHSDLKDHFNAALSEAQKLLADIEHQQKECS
jgi:hypothetical protein